jgi:preprotein translocase subunit SecB
MSEDSTRDQEPGAAAAGGGQVMLERLYLKDASFESPRAPAVFTETWKPEFSLDINTRASSLGEDRFEVVLSATLRANSDGESGKTAYIVEIQQAGVFHVSGLPDEDRQRVLGTLCPGTLFPYVRETVDNLVVKGGFPAVHLAPVNFEGLYAEARRKQAAGGESTTQH